jgi:hypothetical protein
VAAASAEVIVVVAVAVASAAVIGIVAVAAAVLVDAGSPVALIRAHWMISRERTERFVPAFCF